MNSGCDGRTPTADYGLDAPGVVRNLLLVGASGFLLWATSVLQVWSGRVAVGPIGGVRLIFPVKEMGLQFGIAFTAVGLWMIWTSKVGKVRRRERLLNRIPWTGRERVLDVGCGRGLMLIGAARRLTTGQAFGIDRWQAEDLTGNRPDAIVENARREHVAARVSVQTADMRSLPFPDAAFDVVLSCSAIHNVYERSERGRVIDEIARVLKPGGRALIDDIRHGREYAARFADRGCIDVRRTSSLAGMAAWAIITMGSLRPVTLLVKK